MADKGTVALSRHYAYPCSLSERIRRFVFAFEADAEGNASGLLSELIGELPPVGLIAAVQMSPDAESPPAEGYDISLRDPDDPDLVDIIDDSSLKNITAESKLCWYPAGYRPLYTDLLIEVAAAGEGGKGIFAIVVVD